MKYTREEARIKATQKAYEIRHHGRPFRTQAVSFQEWFLAGVRKYEAQGAEFELIETGMIKIIWPGKPAILRTVADLEREYKESYLSKIPA
jgi:hypothetical protein